MSLACQCLTDRRFHGAGVKIGLRSVGPGLVTQETVVCSSCKAAGKVFKEKDRCKKCKGERVTVEKKALEIYIPPGSKYLHPSFASTDIALARSNTS